MFNRLKKRRLVLIALIGGVSLFAACSYLTEFVVVNQSDDHIVVRYKIKNYPGPLNLPAVPSTIESSRLSKKHAQEWQELTSDEYQLDEHNRTVVVDVRPHQALLIASMHHYMGHDDVGDAQDYPIEEVTVTGTQGELKLAGPQARVMFSEISRVLYTLSYK